MFFFHSSVFITRGPRGCAYCLLILLHYVPFSVYLKFYCYSLAPDQDFDACGNGISEYIEQKQPLGGLIFLLPRMFSPENKDVKYGGDEDPGKELMKNILVELERFLLYANIPVSKD